MKNIEVKNKIKKYKELKADIVDINIRIAEKERECICISPIAQGERISPTHKITSSVENQAEKHMEEVEKLLHMRFIKESEIKKIDNALSVLTDIENSVITGVFIHRHKYSVLEEKVHLSYPRIKQIEQNAINKMKKYIL